MERVSSSRHCLRTRSASARVTKYPLHRLIKLAFDGIFNFSTTPLTAVFIGGLLMSGISFILLLLVLVFRIFDIPIFGMRASDVQGFSSTILTILLIGGIQLISTGVLGEYIGRIYTEAKGRPTYIILDKIVHPDTGLSSRTARTGILRSPPMARMTDDTA